MSEIRISRGRPQLPLDTEPLGRPEEILEVDDAIETCAVLLADTISDSLPNAPRDEIYKGCRYEIEAAAGDLGDYFFSEYGQPPKGKATA